MADAKRQQIIDAIVTRLSGIDGTGDYDTTIGSNVTDWGVNYQETDLPAVSVCDLNEEVQTDTNDEFMDVYRLPVSIRVSVSASTRASDLRKMFKDILTAIGADEKWNGLAQFTQVRNIGMTLDQDAFRIAGGQVEIDVYYETQRWKYDSN